MTNRSKKALFGLCAVLVFAVVGYLLCTASGVAVSPDSVVYLDTAQSFANGNGLSVSFGYTSPQALTHFPPLFPMLLGTIAKFSGGVLPAAKWLMLFFFLGNILLVFTVAREVCCSPLIGLILSALFATSSPIFSIHTACLSEPMFLSFLLIGTWSLIRHAVTGRATFLLCSALAIGMSILVRYAGLPFIAAGAAMVVLSATSRRGKFVNGLSYAVLASAPLALMILFRALSGVNPTNRVLRFHPVSLSAILTGLGEAGRYVFPGQVPDWCRAGFTALLLGVLVVGWLRRARSRGYDWPLSIPLALAVSYVMFLLVSITVADAATPLDARMLVPAAVLGTLFAARLLIGSAVWPRAAAVSLVAATFLIVAGGARCLLNRSQERLGYASSTWRNSPGVKFVSGLPKNVTVYSNSADALWFWTGRNALWVPGQVDGSSRDPLPENPQVLRAIQDPQSVVVMFENDRPYLYSGSFLQKRLGLVAGRISADVVVYRAPKSL